MTAPNRIAQRSSKTLANRGRSLIPGLGSIDVPFDLPDTRWTFDIALRDPSGSLLLAECRGHSEKKCRDIIMHVATFPAAEAWSRVSPVLFLASNLIDCELHLDDFVGTGHRFD
jgi:hypothetical protein